MKFLIDASEMTVILPIFDHLYNPPATQYVDDEGAGKKNSVAVILPQNEKSIEVTQFYESMCRNLGWSAIFFSERQSAIYWLLGKAGSNKPDAHPSQL